MVGIVIEGGRGSTKTIMLVYCLKIAKAGAVNFVLRRKYRVPYTVMANMATYFCHPSVPQIDRAGITTYLPGCSDPEAQPGGVLDPNDLHQIVVEGDGIDDYHALGIHESHRWFEARITMALPREAKKRRVELTYKMGDEMRKKHSDIILDTQSRDRLEPRLRNSADYLILCENQANDKEYDLPIPFWTVWVDPFTRHPQMFEYGSPHTTMLARAIIPLYNTWEKPPQKTEIRVAAEEKEAELEKMKAIKSKDWRLLERVAGIKVYPEAEDYKASRVRRSLERLRGVEHDLADVN
jgi:hypothetical protein